MSAATAQSSARARGSINVVTKAPATAEAA